MHLSDSPGRPACPSRASGWSSLTTPWGLPCCVRFPCVHAVATTPAQRLGVLLRSFTLPYQPSPITLSGRPAHCPFRGLLGVHSRYGLHTIARRRLILMSFPVSKPRTVSSSSIKKSKNARTRGVRLRSLCISKKNGVTKSGMGPVTRTSSLLPSPAVIGSGATPGTLHSNHPTSS